MRKLAVLIDADNTSSELAKELFAEIAKYGTASVKRIYGDWTVNPQGWRDKLLDFAITPIQQFAYTKGKNATDMQLIIDAMDLLYSDTFDGFCLVSSDSDFPPIATRLRQSGKLVYGFGKTSTPKSFINAVDQFIYLENLIQKPKTDNIQALNKDLKVMNLSKNTPIEQIIYSAIKSSYDDNGWATLTNVNRYIRNIKPDYDSRSYGFSQFKKHLQSLGNIQIKLIKDRAYCRKIPFGAIVKILADILQNNNNHQIVINKIEKEVQGKWNWKEYGFENFREMLEKITIIEFLDENTIKLKDT